MTDAEMSAAGDAGQPAPASQQPIPEAHEGALADLEAQLAATRAEVDKYRDEWLRAKAETDNVRRRSQEDIAKAHRYGQEAFASALLAVKDSLDAALATEKATVESFKEGMDITARQLDAAFEKHSVKAVNPMGEKFDPHYHQAISQVDSDKEPNTVVTVLQKGYLLHDRVLRPALVVVSRARDA